MSYRPHHMAPSGICYLCGLAPSEGGRDGCPGARPVLVGMNNPISSEPEHALYPAPEGCTGHRVWAMLDGVRETSRIQYRRRFKRTNILPGRTWDRAAARVAGARLVETWLGPRVLVLGAESREVLGLPKTPAGEWSTIPWGWGRARVAWVPHPSGRNPWYNYNDNRRLVGEILVKLYEGSEL